jgi:hypothetical protein
MGNGTLLMEAGLTGSPPAAAPAAPAKKQAGSEWLLGGGKEIFEIVLKGLLAKGMKISAEMDNTVARVLESQAARAGVRISPQMVRHARHRLGLKKYVKRPKAVAAPTPAEQLPQQTAAMEVYSSAGNVYRAGETVVELEVGAAKSNRIPKTMFDTAASKLADTDTAISRRILDIAKAKTPELYHSMRMFPDGHHTLVKFAVAVIDELTEVAPPAEEARSVAIPDRERSAPC